jgi:chromosome segregation ATPase
VFFIRIAVVHPGSNITTSTAGRVAELQATVKDLEDQLHQQEEEANTAITQWQGNCATSEERRLQLEKELEFVNTENGSLSKAMGAIEQDNEQLETDKAALDEKIASLEAGLSSAADSDEIEQLRTELRETQEILREAKETMARDEDVVHQWEGMFGLHFV